MLAKEKSNLTKKLVILGGTYPLAHFLGNFGEKTKKVPTRTVSRKLPEISQKVNSPVTTCTL